MTKRRHGVKRISRNKKSYWRKGTDVAAVEEFAESVRENERLGISTKSDADLFFVHKQPGASKTDEIVRCVKKVELKCFRNLKPDSAVKALPRTVKSSKKLTRKREMQLSKIAKKKTESKSKTVSRDQQHYDLWDDDAKVPSTSLEPDLEDYYLRHTKRRLPNTPSSVLQTTTKLAKIEPPHPGQSYNPTFADHQALLKQALVDEIHKEKEEVKLARKLKITGDIATEESRLAELREGLQMFKEEEKSDQEEDDDDDEAEDHKNRGKLTVPISAENRKLSVQKKKELTDKINKRNKIKEKRTKRLANDVYRLRGIKNEIKQQEEKSKRKIAKRAELKEAKFYKPAVLSRHKYEPAELDVHLSGEVPGSLREMKPEGNVLEDRYKSLQRRNIVETRVFYPGNKRKYKLKKYEKRGCREVTADYVPR